MKMKRAQPPETDFMDGFGQWLESEEGLQSMDAVDCVYSALDGASVDVAEKKIIWSDGRGLINAILRLRQELTGISDSSGNTWSGFQTVGQYIRWTFPYFRV